jgi:hypothetical protein
MGGEGTPRCGGRLGLLDRGLEPSDAAVVAQRRQHVGDRDRGVGPVDRGLEPRRRQRGQHRLGGSAAGARDADAAHDLFLAAVTDQLGDGDRQRLLVADQRHTRATVLVTREDPGQVHQTVVRAQLDGGARERHAVAQHVPGRVVEASEAGGLGRLQLHDLALRVQDQLDGGGERRLVDRVGLRQRLRSQSQEVVGPAAVSARMYATEVRGFGAAARDGQRRLLLLVGGERRGERGRRGNQDAERDRGGQEIVG